MPLATAIILDEGKGDRKTTYNKKPDINIFCMNKNDIPKEDIKEICIKILKRSDFILISSSVSYNFDHSTFFLSQKKTSYVRVAFGNGRKKGIVSLWAFFFVVVVWCQPAFNRL